MSGGSQKFKVSEKIFHNLLINSLSRPLPPNYFRKRVPRGQTCQSCLLSTDRKRLIEKLLNPGQDDDLEVGLGLKSARVVLGDAGVFSLVLPLQLEGGKSPRGLV